MYGSFCKLGGTRFQVGRDPRRENEYALFCLRGPMLLSRKSVGEGCRNDEAVRWLQQIEAQVDRIARGLRKMMDSHDRASDRKFGDAAAAYGRMGKSGQRRTTVDSWLESPGCCHRMSMTAQ